jgi:hypothetical protein
MVWSLEGDAWVGVPSTAGQHARGCGDRHGCEVELLLRATDWHVEMSHVARGEFERQYIQASDAEEAKAKAADLLRAFQAKCEAPIGDERRLHLGK